VNLAGGDPDMASAFGNSTATLNKLQQSLEDLPHPTEAPGKDAAAASLKASEHTIELWQAVKRILRQHKKAPKGKNLFTAEQQAALAQAIPHLVRMAQQLHADGIVMNKNIKGYNKQLAATTGELAAALLQISSLQEEGRQLQATTAAIQVSADTPSQQLGPVESATLQQI
jgi:seryl-tRNA synthetase